LDKIKEKAVLFSKEKVMKHGLTIMAVLILLFASQGYGQEPKEKRVVATVGADGIQRVEVTGGSYYFDPNVIVVKMNVPVELIVKKAGGATPHNFVLKAPEAGIDFSESLSTEPTRIQFTPTKVGKYPFECTRKFLFFKSHTDRGMHGVLEVME
jgi:plastocyanin domain-containing protein